MPGRIRTASAVGRVTTARSSGISVPPALRQEWQEYHRRNVVPRVILDHANLPRSKVKVDFANL
jgi:hypothetical protein